jgi:hypothetical protein
MKVRLCGLVVKVSGYISIGSGSVPGRYQIFWEVVVLERSPVSWVQLRSSLEEAAAPVYKTESTAVGIRRTNHSTAYVHKSWH